jgi:hypothetical protein
MPTRSLTVGPIGWTITTEPALGPVVDQLIEGVMCVPGPEARRAPSALSLEVVLASGRPVRRELPRLPAFVREGGLLLDRSQGWDAILEVSADRVVCRFTLVEVEAMGAAWAPTLRSLNVAAALRVSLGMAAPAARALLMHAAALDSGRGALLFLGASGQGKTTMVKRLPSWRALSDDAALVWREPSGWWVSGTPLPGKERLARSLTPTRLEGLVFLEPHAPSLALTPVSAGEAAYMALSRLLWFGEPTEAVMALVTSLVNEVPSYRLASSLPHDVEGPLAGLAGLSGLGAA